MHEWIGQKDVQALIMNLARTRGDKGFTKDEAEALVQWVYQARVRAELATMIVQGMIQVDVVDGQVVAQGLSEDQLKEFVA